MSIESNDALGDNLDACLRDAATALQQAGCLVTLLTLRGAHVSPLVGRLLRIAADAVGAAQNLRERPEPSPPDWRGAELDLAELGRHCDGLDIERLTGADLESPREPWWKREPWR